MQISCAPYTQRNPRLSGYYRCVEDFFEELERVHEERYQSRFGYLRPEIRLTIFRYLDCCHEYLVAFSCKHRHFCPSCHQKRVIEFGEWFLEDLAVTVSQRGRGPPVELALSVVEGVESVPLLVYADSQVIEYQEAYYIPEYL